jgi:hypothetical protein
MRPPIRETARAPRYGLTGLSMKDTGGMTKPMEREDSFTLTETSTRVNGRTIRPTASVSTCIQMGLNTRATGRKTSSMEKAKRPGLMVLNMKVTMLRERKMETETSDGRTAPPITESSQIITYTGRACTFGLTNVSTKVIGRITKCMAKACFHGLTAVSTKVNIMMTRNKAMVYLPGPMVANTMANGSMVNNTAKEST